MPKRWLWGRQNIPQGQRKQNVILTRLVSLGRLVGSGTIFTTAPDCGGVGLPFAMLPNWVCASGCVCDGGDDAICW